MASWIFLERFFALIELSGHGFGGGLKKTNLNEFIDSILDDLK